MKTRPGALIITPSVEWTFSFALITYLLRDKTESLIHFNSCTYVFYNRPFLLAHLSDNESFLWLLVSSVLWPVD